MSNAVRPRRASLRRVFAGVLGAAMTFTSTTPAGATEPVAHGEPAHDAPRSPTLRVIKPAQVPSCPAIHMPLLPPRALFEQPEGPHQAEAIAAAGALRDTMLFLEREKEASALSPPPVARRPDFERALPGFSLVLERLGGTSPRERDSTAARVVSAIASDDVRVPWGRDFRGFVDRHRGLFGIRADRRVRVVEDEERVRLEYPNGALSDGRVVTLPTYVGRGTCLRTDIPDGNEIRNDLPLDEAQLSDPPAFSAEEALRRFHDIAPYVSTDSEPPVRLVIATGRTGVARLVWRVSYHYECVLWYANVGGSVTTRHHVADMDAFSGSLL